MRHWLGWRAASRAIAIGGSAWVGCLSRTSGKTAILCDSMGLPSLDGHGPSSDCCRGLARDTERADVVVVRRLVHVNVVYPYVAAHWVAGKDGIVLGTGKRVALFDIEVRHTFTRMTQSRITFITFRGASHPCRDCSCKVLSHPLHSTLHSTSAACCATLGGITLILSFTSSLPIPTYSGT
ncbi:hypothetical protein CGRA01v4_12793 [Colletotrichum graminicola]|nr:hypothetical protein CGRA01v4_12793 [Colletotrichum graminicola]